MNVYASYGLNDDINNNNVNNYQDSCLNININESHVEGESTRLTYCRKTVRI